MILSMFLLVPAWAASAPLAENRAALLVAVTEQPDGFRVLRWTARDVVSVAATLLEPEAGPFNAVEIVADGVAVRAAIEEMVGDPAVPAARRAAIERHREEILTAVDSRFVPTREGIRDALDAFGDEHFPPGRQGTATAMVYLSGHGAVALPPAGQGSGWAGPVRFFVTGDTRAPEVSTTALSVAEINEVLRGIRATRRLLINASCFSAAPGSKGAAGLVVQSRVESELSAGIGASYEDDNLKLDLYTWHLLDGLTTHAAAADTNGDGAVSDTEAHQFALIGVMQFNVAMGQGERQDPAIQHRQIGPDEIILAGRRGRPSRGRVYTSAWASRRFILEARQKGSEDVVSAPLEASIVDLPKGCYAVRIREAGGQLAYAGPMCVSETPLSVERLMDRTERVTLTAGMGTMIPMDRALDDQVTGTALGVRIGVAVPLSRTPPVGWVVGVDGWGLEGWGRQSAFDGEYQTSYLAAAGLASVRRLQRLPMGDLSFGLTGGVMVGRHEADAPGLAIGIADFIVVAPLGGVVAHLDVTPGTRWVFGAESDLLLSALSIDTVTVPRPLVLAGLHIGRRW